MQPECGTTLPSCDSQTGPENAVEWPRALSPDALCGLAGDIVRAIEPHSEADPAALLLHVLVLFGNAVGHDPHFEVEGDRHCLNLFALFVGATSKGRKGTALGRVRSLLDAADSNWANNCMKGGLSSGEGLIWAVRDGDGECGE